MAKKQPTSDWVSGLLDEWIKQIDSEDVLDQIDLKLKRRRAQLKKLTKEYEFEQLLKTYKSYNHGDTVWTLEPLTRRRIEVGEDKWKWHKAIFWQYQPRKKIMWLAVDWVTPHKHRGKYFISLNKQELFQYQPSRTEPDVRARALRRAKEQGKLQRRSKA